MTVLCVLLLTQKGWFILSIMTNGKQGKSNSNRTGHTVSLYWYKPFFWPGLLRIHAWTSVINKISCHVYTNLNNLNINA